MDAAGRKVTEEATEVLIAAKDDAAAEASGADRTATRDALAGETADLLYHALVLLAERGLADPSRRSSRRHAPASPRRLLDTLSSARRPISRRRLPIRTSSHSPAIGSGTKAGSATRSPLIVTPPPAIIRRASPREANTPASARSDRRPAGDGARANVNPPADSNSDRERLGVA